MPQDSFTFAYQPHDRRSVVRSDPAALDALWRDPKARVLVVGGGQVAGEDGGIRYLAPAEAPQGERIYLGEYDGISYLGVIVEEIVEELQPVTLRKVATSLSEAEGGLLVHASGLANWHRTHPRCARCGEPTRIEEAGHLRVCPACEAQHFPRTDPAVIMLITDRQDRALLGRQAAWPEGRYSVLAGFVEPGESLEGAVRREVAEEAGIRVGSVTYAGSQPWPFPSNLMLGFFGEAETFDIHVDGSELEAARWFSREEVTELTNSHELALPGRLSISNWLLDTWHGAPVGGGWG